MKTKDLTQAIRDLVDARRLSLPTEFQMKVLALTYQADREAERRKAVSVGMYVAENMTDGVWPDGTPVVGLTHLRGQLYTSNAGNHDVNDTVWVK